MTKDVEIQDFSCRQHFPGVTGNPFDVFLHKFGRLEKIPSVFYGLILAILAAISTGFDWPKAAAQFVFFLVDWLLLFLLPRYRKSYGPSKPPVLALAVLRCLVAWTPAWINFSLQGLGTLLVIYAFWIEPHSVRLTRQTLQSPKLAAGQFFTVLHIGDLHIERITRREKQLNEIILQLKPDLILFSGDVLSLSNLGDSISLQHAREILYSWQAPGGVYAVPGSPAIDLPEVLPAIYAELPITLLMDQQVQLNIRGAEITLIGLNCTHRPFIDDQNLPIDLAENVFSILLYHSPDLAPVSATRGIDLQLSGHTHGGQIRLPLIGPLFTGSLYGRQFTSGRYKIGKMDLYITRGLGVEGAGAPRARFFCPPEVILWEIRGGSLNS